LIRWSLSISTLWLKYLILPTVKKTFHAAEYDIICLKRDYSFSFQNIFDTMIAARVLGVREVGLNTLLKAEYGMELDKQPAIIPIAATLAAFLVIN
jgi:ribonuclease D